MPDPRRRLRGRTLIAWLALLVALALAGPLAVRAGPQASDGPHPAAARAGQPAPPVATEELVRRVVELTNQERAKAGLPPVALDAALCRAAQAHSDDMAAHGLFSHTGSDGSDPGRRIAAAGYSPVYAYGENIAAGQPSPEGAVRAWMNSESHRSNILSPYYEHIGVAYAFDTDTTYGHYWTQDFGSHGPNPPPAAAPPPAPATPAAIPPTPVPTPTHIPPTATAAPPTATAPLAATLTPGVPRRAVTARQQIPRTISLSFVERVVDLTNRERAKAGLPALILDTALCNAAQAHSEDMAAHGFFGHTGSDGSTPPDRMAMAGYVPVYAVAGNIAGGQPSPEAVVDAWMSSEEHRRNMLSPVYHHVGVGYAYAAGSAYGHYWTQLLGSHGAAPPTPVPPAPTPPPRRWSCFHFLALLARQAVG